MDYRFLLSLAIILLSTKVFGLISQRVQLPSVVGALLAGLLLGPTCLNMVVETDFLLKTSELGVIFLMFLAGLDTDLKELKKTGLTSLFIAACGVVVPLIGGSLCYKLFFSQATVDAMLRAVFVGVVLAATSVSITVETLRELGRLRGKVGTAILGAAVIDDILGIVVLTILTSFTDPSVKPLMVVGRIVGFFVLLALVGFVVYRLFQKLGKAYYNHRRIAIYGLVFCLLLSYTAEHFFGIADITGAYVAGIVLSSLRDTSYIDRKVDINSYMIFSPVFFANIGIGVSFAGFSPILLLFALCFVLAGILGKIIGCGSVAKLCKNNWKESLQIGCGMIARGEVALVVCNKGIEGGLFAGTVIDPIVPVIMLVVLSSLCCPILLKILFKDKNTLPLTPAACPPADNPPAQTA